MKRSYIRSYRISDHGDIEVVDRRAREIVDLSPHYVDVPRDRGELRIGTCLDVFRNGDGQLAWAGSANGDDNAAATSLALLLNLFLEDAARSLAPRSL